MHTGGGEGTVLERVRRAPLACMARLRRRPTGARKAGGAGHAGRGRNAARWLSLLRALLLCWLPAALLHWRRTQRALASELSSGMPDEHDTALHSTRMQPIRLINLARAGADGPEPRRQVHYTVFFAPAPLSSFRLTGGRTSWHRGCKTVGRHKAGEPADRS